MAETKEISQNEAAVYDRQMRLWGVAAQQRLMSSKVLLCGLDGMHVEVLKNLVLAGIQVTIMESRPVVAADLATNFFLRPGDVGAKLGPVVIERAQEMNPLAKLECVEDMDLTESALAPYSVVLTTSPKMDVLVAQEVDQRCRKLGKAFFLSTHSGMNAFLVADFGETYMVEEWWQAPADSDNTKGFKSGIVSQKMEPETLSFPSLSDCLDTNVAELHFRKKPKLKEAYDCTELCHLLLAFRRFGEAEKKSVQTGAEFAKFVESKQVAGITAEQATNFFEGGKTTPFPVTSAIAGGLAAQEVIKFVTRRDRPHLNTTTIAGAEAWVHTVPKVLKRKAPEPVMIAIGLDDDDDE